MKEILQSRLDAVIGYLDPHSDLINCHMVNYLTDDHWTEFVPQSLRAEVKTVADVQQLIENIFASETCEAQLFPALKYFLEDSQNQRLTNYPELLTSVEKLEDMLSEKEKATLSIKEFLSAKKCHEVEAMAALVNKLVHAVTTDQSNCYIVDAGDGKGYLSSRLALEYKHFVLGIDANESNTKNAISRDSKLQRAWNGLTERAELINQGIIPPRRGKKIAVKETSINEPAPDRYKTLSRYITTELDLSALLKEHFQQDLLDTDPAICLTGLHTCGNLASTCLQVFHAQDSCRVLCNVGCCYHLLNERYSGDEFFGNKALMQKSTDYGFPLSNYLQKRKFKLGRNARMLAAQSIERTFAAKELPNITLYYRALLEVLVCSYAPHLKNTLQVGKIQKCKTFAEYVQKCALKLNIQWLKDVEETELDSLLEKYESHRHFLSLFYLLRMTFAPIVESVILLDRMLYLNELGYEHSYLVDIFDAVISPRHYAIVAFKDGLKS